MEKKMEKEPIYGQIILLIKASGMKEKYVVKVFTIIKMDEYILALLLITKCTGKAYTYGLMEENTLVSTQRTKNRDMVDITGLMEDIMKENGETEKETATEK